jgi:hypothetical protein
MSRYRWLPCGIAAIVSACATGQPAPGAVSLAAQYEHAIRAAAVRDPGFETPLRSIPPGQTSVTVATFTEWGPPSSPTQRPTWVSLPDQLRQMCHGKPDAVLAIQQILGLPPQAAPSHPAHHWEVITLNVPRKSLFRPCPGGTDIAAPRCVSTLADRSAIDDATARFLLDQVWSSDRVGFHTNNSPDWGYPFTGMGWTYNWDPAAASPIGMSEFVLRPAARVTVVDTSDPAAFCAAAAP